MKADEPGRGSHDTDRGDSDDAPDAQDDGTADHSASAASGSKDAGRSTTSGESDSGGSSGAGAKDAGAGGTESRDSGASGGASPVGGPRQAEGAGQPSSAADAQRDGGGRPSADGPPTASDTDDSTSDSETGDRDPSGPCEDLQLFCFDIFDMFIFNPSDCFTCNNGDGCQGCAFPFAY